MEYKVLASGSKGNATIIKTGNTTLLIDCGTTKKYLQSAFDELGINLIDLDAVLITHTHKDHVSQIKMFVDANVPIYALGAIKDYDINFLDDINYIGDFEIEVLKTSHDTSFSCGFILKNKRTKLIYMTDTGYISKRNIEKMHNGDYYILESNHDVEMLMATNRPTYVKQRIISDKGHLCNEDSANYLEQMIGDDTKEVILAHISQEGNDVACIREAFRKLIHDNPQIEWKLAKQNEIVCGGSDD